MSNGSTTALALRDGQLPAEMSLQDTLKLGQVLAQSGYFQDAREASQAVAKILAGRELGIGPIASLTGIYVVKGRVSLSANLIAAQIKRSGRYDFRVTQHDNDGCTIDFYQNGERIGTSAFERKDAEAAGLLNSENYRRFPKNMYYSRAMTNGARWFCPDVFSSPVYTPDELGARVDDQGEIIDVTPTVVPHEPAAPAPEAPTASNDPERDEAIKHFKARVKELNLSGKEQRRFMAAHFDTGDSTTLSGEQIAFLVEELDAFESREQVVEWLDTPDPAVTVDLSSEGR